MSASARISVVSVGSCTLGENIDFLDIANHGSSISGYYDSLFAELPNNIKVTSTFGLLDLCYR